MYLLLTFATMPSSKIGSPLATLDFILEAVSEGCAAHLPLPHWVHPGVGSCWIGTIRFPTQVNGHLDNLAAKQLILHIFVRGDILSNIVIGQIRHFSCASDVDSACGS